MQSNREIVIGQGQVNALSERFARVWKRKPTPKELDALVQEFVIEEMYYREALAMGIDRNDPVIRRRLRQKMEMYTDDLASALKPTDEQLKQYLKAQPEKFSADSRYTFRQIFVSTDRPEGQLQEVLARFQARLKAGEQPSGDATMLPSVLDEYTATDITRTFGRGFAEKLDGLQLNEWSTPLHSSLGVHLVLLTEREPAYLPPLSAIRGKVEQEWRYDQAQRLDQRLREKLLASYDVRIESRGEAN